MEPIEVLLSRLNKVRSMGRDKWSARCPSHNDKTPSLSISLRDERILLHCFAGCSTEDVLAAVGLTFSDLYADPWRASKEAAIANKGKKALESIHPLAVDWMVLKIAAADLRAGKTLSLEDQARVELAKQRVKGVA